MVKPFHLILPCFLLFIMGCSVPRILMFSDPLTPEEHLKLGVAYEQEEEYEAALREYGAASKELDIAHLYLGNVHFHLKEYDSAEDAYQKAIQKMPGNPRAYNNLAWMYYTRDMHLEKGEELAIKAVELAPPGQGGEYRDTLEKILEARKNQDHQDDEDR